MLNERSSSAKTTGDKEAVQSLRGFIKALVKARIKDKEHFRRWKKKNEALMEELFWYKKTDPKMPSITALVMPFFHPTEPLIGLNYTPVAHNTLFQFPNGWTIPLRLCRGIVFSRRGRLVAKPFNKFFNYGENKETKELPDEPFDATVKHDGHLGIIFEYLNRLFLTTRGDFQSRTSKIGNEMLAACVKSKRWNAKFLKDLTVLVEVIHPATKVHLDYNEEQKFMLIGACNRVALEDFDYAELTALGRSLDLEVTERWSGKTLENLKALMVDLTVRNREGFVVRFQNGLRVKFKFATYINKMVESKIGYAYLMKRIQAGNLEKMIQHLPEEIYAQCLEMLANLYRVKDDPIVAALSEKEKRQYLYALLPEDKRTASYTGHCRAFLKWLSIQPQK